MIAGIHLPDSEAHRDKLASSNSGFADSYLFVILARLFGAIMDRVPLGYEDDKGFHWEQVRVQKEDV